MEFIGEHLLPGQLGHFFTILSLVASLVATIAFYKAANIMNLEKRIVGLELPGRLFCLKPFLLLPFLFPLLHYFKSSF